MFDTEVFINEIQTRPPLWNTKLKDYSNRDIKAKLWIEVGSTTVQNWDELNNADKNKEVNELQKKWKSIRDAFTREVRLQKQPSGSGKRTRKRYIYFDQLLFLLDSLEERWTLTNFNTGEEHSGDETNNEAHESADTMLVTGDVASLTSASQNLPPIRRAVKRQASTFEQEVLQHIKSRKSNEENDDKLFLLSLVPMFMKLDDRTKAWTRMKFMETMQQALTFGIHMPSNTRNISAHPSFSNISLAYPTFSNNTPEHHPSGNNPAHLQLGNIIPTSTQMVNNIPAYPPFFNSIPTHHPSTNNILTLPPMSNNISASYPQRNNTNFTKPFPSPCPSRPSSAAEPPAESPTYTDLSSSNSQGSTFFDINEL